MTEKPDLNMYQQILDNFDAFCDGFEQQAAERFLRGNDESPVLSRYADKHRGATPRAVTEVSEPGTESLPARESTIDVQASDSDGVREDLWYFRLSTQ